MATVRPRPGKIGLAVRRYLRGFDLEGSVLVSAALAEVTADLADSAYRGSKSREFSVLVKDLERLLREVRGEGDARSDDSEEVGGVEPEPIQPRGLAAVLGPSAQVGDRKVS